MVLKGRSMRLEDWAVEKVVFDGFGTEVATAKVIFGHSSLVKKVRRRECPDKIWISWWGVFVSCRIFALSILLKNSFVIDDSEFSFSHSSLHCCLRKFWIGSLAFDQNFGIFNLRSRIFCRCACFLISDLVPRYSFVSWNPVKANRVRFRNLEG